MKDQFKDYSTAEYLEDHEASMKSPQQQIGDFLQGQEDCKNGVPHQEGRGEDYNRGYEYEQWRKELKESSLSPLIAEYR